MKFLKPERWSIERLKANPQNARSHSTAQLDLIRGSIREHGFTVPIVVAEDGLVLAGHGRLEAAKAEGFSELPVLVAEGWSAEQRRAYAIRDNQLGLRSTWNETILRAELAELSSLGFDLQAIGFDETELLRLTGAKRGGKTDPDAAPPPPPDPVSRLGDLWVLGAHRLRCGDSTQADHVAHVLGSVKPLLMVTDPPYGVEYDPDWRNQAERASGKKVGARATGKVRNDDRADWTPTWKLFPGDVAYIWHAGRFASTVQASIEAAGFEVRSQIIWAKNRHALSRGHYHWQHEPCWYAVREGGKGHWAGDRSQTTLWRIDGEKLDTGHGTQKPVECMKRPIENNSSPGQAVYEPFSGSGTTIIAAEMTGRACHAIELDPAYVDVAVQRWEAFTGEKARLEDGRAFAEVAEERRPQAA